jgi:hypothetical protein
MGTVRAPGMTTRAEMLRVDNSMRLSLGSDRGMSFWKPDRLLVPWSDDTDSKLQMRRHANQLICFSVNQIWGGPNDPFPPGNPSID